MTRDSEASRDAAACPGSPLVRDRREAFAEHIDQLARAQGRDISGLLHLPSTLADSQEAAQVVREPTDIRPTLVVPGLLGSSVRTLVAPLLCARRSLTTEGYPVSVAWVSGRSGADRNAKTLRRIVDEYAQASGKPVTLLGYSKGCADALHMLARHPESAASVHTLVSYAGVVHGTPLANDVAAWKQWLLRYLPLPGEAWGDGQAIRDLQPVRRAAFLAEHPLPDGVRYASVVTSPEPRQVSRVLRGSYRALQRFAGNNDSQVLVDDMVLPRGELLAVVNADHWAVALPIAERLPLLARLLVDRNECPRDLFLRAIIDFVNTD